MKPKIYIGTDQPESPKPVMLRLVAGASGDQRTKKWYAVKEEAIQTAAMVLRFLFSLHRMTPVRSGQI